MIDPHVHGRDWLQFNKETLERIINYADLIGLSGIFEEPNTNPKLLFHPKVDYRIEEADKFLKDIDLFHGVYIGITKVPKGRLLKKPISFQLNDAVNTYNNYRKSTNKKLVNRVVGLKMFTDSKDNETGISTPEEQFAVYSYLASLKYEGIIAIHAEDVSEFDKFVFDPNHPKTHSYARPESAETRSISKQIELAKKARFKGKLYFKHVSTPKGFMIIEKERNNVPFQIYAGITPHHCLLNIDMIPDSREGLIYKVNPPIRERKTQMGVMYFLLESAKKNRGWVWIETDHAPHTLKDKMEEPYLSGFPGIPFYPHFIRYLKEKQGLSETEINMLTHYNITNAFEINIPNKKKEPLYSLQTQYPFDVYNDIRDKLI